MCRAAFRPVRWTSPPANSGRGSDLQFRLHCRGEGWPPRDLVKKARKAGPTWTPGPHLVTPRDILQRGAEHDLRGVDRSVVMALSEGGLERVGGALGPSGFERDDPGRLQTEAQFAVPHRDGVEKGIGAAGFGDRLPAVGAVHRQQASTAMLG